MRTPVLPLIGLLALMLAVLAMQIVALVKDLWP
jgi:hypothetical protein